MPDVTARQDPAEPGAVDPDSAEAESAKADTGDPGAAGPDTSDPDTTEPGTTEPGAVRPDTTAPATNRRRPGVWVAVLGGLIAAWLLPVICHLFRVDWVLPLVIWGFTASLLRNGRTALDRLMLAAVLLFGATCLAGLVISLWPYGMRPVPVASSALTALVVIAALLRRRPRLPRHPKGSDLLALGSGVLAATVVTLPFVRADFATRIGLMVPAEDMARHFSLYDAIGIIDGYAFFDRHESDPYLLFGMQTYPQGSHFLYALLDNFLRSGGAPATTINSWDHYVGYHIAGYAFFAVAILWATRWVAGPSLTGWPKAAVYTFVAAAVSFSELVAMFIRGYPSEILGLALFAVLLALLARPPRHTRELIITVAALIIGISWAYFFLLPFIGVVAIACLVGFRHRLLAHWVTALLSGLVTVPIALTPYLIMYADRVSPLADLLPGGPVEGVDRGLTVGIAALLLAGLATVPRSPVWRMIGAQLALVAALTVALGCYQIVSIGHLSYYFDKSVHVLFVTCLVGLSAATPLLAKVRRPASAERRIPDVAVASLVVVGILAGFAALPLERPSARGVEPIRNVSWGHAYAAGNLHNHGVGKVIATVVERYPDSDGRLTQVVFANEGASYLSSLFVSVLRREQGTLRRQDVAAKPLYHVKDMDVTITDFAAPRRIIVVNSPETAEQIDTVLASRPDLDVELISLRVEGARV